MCATILQQAFNCAELINQCKRAQPTKATSTECAGALLSSENLSIYFLLRGAGYRPPAFQGPPGYGPPGGQFGPPARAPGGYGQPTYAPPNAGGSSYILQC